MHKGTTLSVKPHSRLMHWYRWQPYRLPLFNTTARMAMSINFSLGQFLTNGKLEDQKTKDFFQNKQVFFGLSTIRSGSTFLADLLESEITNGQIEHEPNVNDYWSYAKVLKSNQHADNYINTYRKKDMVKRCTKKETAIYGELNPFLVLHAAAIKKAIPTAKLFHLVRDGRDVVRSIMAREVLGNKDPMLKVITPPVDDPYFEQWFSMSRFERVCWKWQYENKVLRTAITQRIHFEKMITNYDYFKKELLDFLRIEISKKHWNAYSKQPKHASPQHSMLKWDNWAKTQKEQFEKICGAEMKANGY